jgi:UPF0755 protein
MMTVKRLAGILAFTLLLGFTAAGFAVYTRIAESFRGYATPDQEVEIPAGAGTRAIGERLVASGVVRDRLTYRIALWLSGDARRLQAGEYRFEHPMTPLEVIGKIARGEVDVVPVTFPEGLTIAEMARIFEGHGFGPAAAFVAAAKDASLVAQYDPGAQDLEGYLFPDTYLVPRRSNAVRVVGLMAERFAKMTAGELRAVADARGLTTRQWVTLASIVEKETAQPDERPLVAAVYENRLRIGMGLQCDPTVIYALERAGRYNGNLRRDDLAFDSPYNTYRYRGLPPGPIASPGKASLEAVVHPAQVSYLYFVGRNDGTHVFSDTLDEHNRNVQKWQVQYFRELKSRDTTSK